MKNMFLFELSMSHTQPKFLWLGHFCYYTLLKQISSGTIIVINSAVLVFEENIGGYNSVGGW